MAMALNSFTMFEEKDTKTYPTIDSAIDRSGMENIVSIIYIDHMTSNSLGAGLRARLYISK